MAIYHLSQQIIKRSEGRSAVACAAYRNGRVLYDKRLDKTYSFARKDRVAHSEIFLPEGAPKKFLDSECLWNEVEEIEKRTNAQLARECDVALPIELTQQQNIALAREFTMAIKNQGKAVELNLHNLDGANPHFHLMECMRNINSDGLGSKNRVWNEKSCITEMRQTWETICNKHLTMAGHDEDISCKSHKALNIETTPTVHHGNRPQVMTRNNQIIQNNAIYTMAVNALNNAKQASNKLKALVLSWSSKKPEDIKKTEIDLEDEKFAKEEKQIEIIKAKELEKKAMTENVKKKTGKEPTVKKCGVCNKTKRRCKCRKI
jgi:ATP-dependent exoDNAse (exonuclease V) alpha subunit